jgi:hypothetical protein
MSNSFATSVEESLAGLLVTVEGLPRWGYQRATNSQADVLPGSSDPIHTVWVALMEGRFKVEKKKTLSHTTVLRFLVSKIVARRGWTVEDWTIFNHSLVSVSQQCGKDEPFRRKYEKLVEIAKLLNKYLSSKRELVLPAFCDSEAEVIVESLSKTFSATTYFSQERDFYKQVRVRVFNLPPRTTRPRARPPGFIGVGYRDKGHRRDTAADGSPDWKEICGDWRIDGLDSLESLESPAEKRSRKGGPR